MKNIFKLLFVLGLLTFNFSCDEVEYIELNSNANTELMLSLESVILEEDSQDNEILTANWTDPDYGFDAAASYKVLIDINNGDFSAPQVLPVGNSLEKTFTVGELNAKMLSLGLAPNEESVVSFKIQITLSDYQEMFSNTVNLNVTPFSSLLDLSTNLGVVGSATAAGWGNPNIPDLPFYQTNIENEYVAYVSLKNGEIKFRSNNDWADNWGDDGNDGTLDPYGANILVTAGDYKITVNFDNLTWSMEEFTWGLVGSATTNGWDGPDMKLYYNSYQDDFKTVVSLNDGEVKFRFNNDWTLNYGDSGADGSLEIGGDNIVVSAGHYLVTMSLNTLTYTLEPMDVWGLVGSATANGWDGPNDKFIPDFGINEGYYYINGAVLNDGEIKVRQNDAWGVNYGDDGNDGSMELNGANIPVSAGTYNIALNFSVSPPTISINQW